MADKLVMYAWHSPSDNEVNGDIYWRTVDGREIVVSLVDRTPPPEGVKPGTRHNPPGNRRNDLIYQGEVVEHVRNFREKKFTDAEIENFNSQEPQENGIQK